MSFRCVPCSVDRLLIELKYTGIKSDESIRYHYQEVTRPSSTWSWSLLESDSLSNEKFMPKFDVAVPLVAGAPIVMFINIYAGDSPIRKTCNFDEPLNHILKVMDGCMHIFCLVSIKTHKIRMLKLQPSPFFTDSLHEA